MPKYDEAALEAEIKAKGKIAPRITPDDIDSQIVGEHFHVVPHTSLTICVLTLKNGFHVTGESASASIENFDAAIGRRIARDNARNKIWALEGYALRNRIAEKADWKPITPAQMRAKVRVNFVGPNQEKDTETGGFVVTSERLMFNGVCKSDGYGEDGLDENNTFAKFSPAVLVDMYVNNPALIGAFESGDTFYLDFIPAPK